MITNWYYDVIDYGVGRTEVKKILSENNYNSIDVGAGVLYWSYPECLNVVDIIPTEHYNNGDSRVKGFVLNLHNPNTWDDLLKYVETNGKFDYSICSHTLEDIYNPVEVIDLLQKISTKGFIAIPSKYNEMTKRQSQNYRGYAHHKFIFNMKKDNVLRILPKSSFIENDNRSDLLSNFLGSKMQLCIFWEEKIDYEFLAFEPAYSDTQLIDWYFNMLEDEE